MPVLSEYDFDKLASRIVDQFLSGDTSLADAAAKVASTSQLNPDQIERLVQAANTQTFLRMMDQRKEAGADDLLHEFDPIDSRQVIQIVIDDAGVHVNGPHPIGGAPETEDAAPPSDENELPDEMAVERNGNPEEIAADQAVEEAEEAENAAKKVQKVQKEEKEAALRTMRLRKLGAILEDAYLQNEWAFEEAFDALSVRFKRAHVELPFEAFEKDALAENSSGVGISILNTLRETRGLAPLPPQEYREKAAALADRHVCDETPELQAFENLVKLAHESQKIHRGLEWIKSQCA